LQTLMRVHHIHSGGIRTADDLTDPRRYMCFRISLRHVLSRNVQVKASIRPSTCSSQIQTWQRPVSSETGIQTGQEIRKTCAVRGLKDIVAMLGLEQLSRKTVMRSPRAAERFLTQPFSRLSSSADQRKTVSLKDSLDGCERILRDEFKIIPRGALYDRSNREAKKTIRSRSRTHKQNPPTTAAETSAENRTRVSHES